MRQNLYHWTTSLPASRANYLDLSQMPELSTTSLLPLFKWSFTSGLWPTSYKLQVPGTPLFRFSNFLEELTDPRKAALSLFPVIKILTEATEEGEGFWAQQFRCHSPWCGRRPAGCRGSVYHSRSLQYGYTAWQVQKLRAGPELDSSLPPPVKSLVSKVP